MKIFQNLNIKGLMTIFGSFLNVTTVGTMYLWGTIQIYVISYYREEGQKEITLSVGGIIFPFMMLFMSLGMFFGVPLVYWTQSSQKFFFMMSLLIPGFYILSGFIKDFYLFIFVYGILNGLVLGILYISSIFIAFQHFPAHKGKVSGCTAMGYGLGQLVYSIFAQNILNPDKLSPIKLEGDQFKYFQGASAHVASKVPEFFWYMALIIFIQMTLSNFLLISLPPDMNLNLYLKDIKKKGLRMMWIQVLNEERFTLKKQAQYSKQHEVDHKDQIHLSITKIQLKMQETFQNNNPANQFPIAKGDGEIEIQWQDENEFIHHVEKTDIIDRYPNQCPAKKYVFKSWVFYFAILVGTNAAGPGLFLNAQYKNYYIQISNDEAFILIVSLVNSLGNSLMRFVWGFLLDIFEPKQIICFISLIYAIIFGSFDAASQNKYIFLLYNFLVMGLYGGIQTLLPVLFSKLFGIDMGSKIFGFMWIGLSAGNFFQYFLVQFLEPVIKFQGIFWIYFAISAFNFIALLFIPLKYDWTKQIQQYHQSQKQRLSKLYH